MMTTMTSSGKCPGRLNEAGLGSKPAGARGTILASSALIALDASSRPAMISARFVRASAR